jgi:putative iron-regulated protein
VAFDTKDQEDEHSCFSDNTHVDHLEDVRGIRNAWLGDYLSSDGANDAVGLGIRDVASSASAPLVAELDGILANLMVACQDADLAPFDQAILGADSTPGRQAVQTVMNLLAQFNIAFSDLAAEMDVEVFTGGQD